MKNVFTPNKFFALAGVIMVVALWLCYATDGWNEVHPFVSSSFDMLCACGALYYYCMQSQWKRSRFTHVMVSVVMASIAMTLVNDWLYTALAIANKGAKDKVIADKINAMYDVYFACYTIVGLALVVGICTFLFAYVSTGHNDFKNNLHGKK